MPALTLYIQPGFSVPGHRRCFSGTPFAIKVARALRYKGLDFQVDEVGWVDRRERLPRISCSGKLPVLDYDGERIEDSTEIAYYVETKHPSPSLFPRDPLLRARCHLVEEWADETLYWYGVYEQRRFSISQASDEAYFAELPEGARKRAAERLRDAVEQSMSAQGVGRYPVEKVKTDVRRGLDALSVFLDAHPFVAGPSLCLADLALFGQLERRLAGTNPWLAGEIRARASLSAWLRRVNDATRMET